MAKAKSAAAAKKAAKQAERPPLAEDQEPDLSAGGNLPEGIVSEAVTVETFAPFRVTRLGVLRPFGKGLYTDPHEAVRAATEAGAASDGERFTILPLFDYPE